MLLETFRKAPRRSLTPCNRNTESYVRCVSNRKFELTQASAVIVYSFPCLVLDTAHYSMHTIKAIYPIRIIKDISWENVVSSIGVTTAMRHRGSQRGVAPRTADDYVERLTEARRRKGKRELKCIPSIARAGSDIRTCRSSCVYSP